MSVEQAMNQMQQEMANTRDQLASMARAHDQLRASHEALRHDSQTAFQRKAAEVQELEERLRLMVLRLLTYKAELMQKV